MTHERFLQPESKTRFRQGQAVLRRVEISNVDGVDTSESGMEDQLIHAAELLFSDHEREVRYQAFAEALRPILERHPDEPELAAFYALVLLALSHHNPNLAQLHAGAITVLEDAAKRYPNHVGILHYLIHAYDSVPSARQGLAAALRLQNLRPEYPHTAHMPSHIFFRLGLWREAAEANEQAFNNSIVDSNLIDADYHSLQWLFYAYLQNGRRREAREYIRKLEAIPQFRDDVALDTEIAWMKLRYCAETTDCERAWTPEGFRVDDPKRFLLSLQLVTAATSALSRDDHATARVAFARFHDLYREDAVPVLFECMRHQLDALLQHASGHSADALIAMDQAITFEQRISYSDGPPFPVKPSEELYAELLLDLNRAAEAIPRFENVLARMPGRLASTWGLARACRLSGKSDCATASYSNLRTLVVLADEDTPEVLDVRAFFQELAASQGSN